MITGEPIYIIYISTYQSTKYNTNVPLRACVQQKKKQNRIIARLI